jgi:hypothetical protein
MTNLHTNIAANLIIFKEIIQLADDKLFGAVITKEEFKRH